MTSKQQSKTVTKQRLDEMEQQAAAREFWISETVAETVLINLEEAFYRYRNIVKERDRAADRAEEEASLARDAANRATNRLQALAMFLDKHCPQPDTDWLAEALIPPEETE